VDEVLEYQPPACPPLRAAGWTVWVPDPLRINVIEIPPITPLVIETGLHRLVCPIARPAPVPPCRRMWGQPL